MIVAPLRDLDEDRQGISRAPRHPWMRWRGEVGLLFGVLRRACRRHLVDTGLAVTLGELRGPDRRVQARGEMDEAVARRNPVAGIEVHTGAMVEVRGRELSHSHLRRWQIVVAASRRSSSSLPAPAASRRGPGLYGTGRGLPQARVAVIHLAWRGRALRGPAHLRPARSRRSATAARPRAAMTRTVLSSAPEPPSQVLHSRHPFRSREP